MSEKQKQDLGKTEKAFGQTTPSLINDKHHRPTLPAVRALDALVAEKVFGLVRCTGCDYYECYAQPDSPNHGGELRGYSTRIEDAWEVVEKMREAGWVYCTVQSTVGDIDVLMGKKKVSSVLWWAAFAKYHSSEEVQSNEHATPAKAICDAALRAMDAPSAVDRSRFSTEAVVPEFLGSGGNTE